MSRIANPHGENAIS